jgi:diguanylate cyclase (GGDEF)-like protein/PAS domain S-box-containing protein
MNAWILIAEAFAVYGLVLWSHSLRHRFGLTFFYALLSCLIAISCWVTDAGVTMQLWNITLLIGSTVFYTSLLLGVFVVYVFDGPRATRMAILMIVGVQALVALVSMVLNLQLRLSSSIPLVTMPIPSLRVNLASVLTNLADMIFLAVCWEYLHGKLGALPLAAKAFLTLLGVMCLDAVLFNTGAFLGASGYLSIMSGTLLSRLFITVFAAPILWAYLSWQNSLAGVSMPHRPVFAILGEMSELRVELKTAHDEILRRKTVEAALVRSEKRYRQLIHNASEPVAVLQNDLYLLHNAKLLELMGVSEHDIQQVSFSDFIHPDDRKLVEAGTDAALKKPGDPRTIEFRAVTSTGETLVVQANIVGIEWDGYGALLAFLHDVTALRSAQQRLVTEATMDELTGVLNRRGFMVKLKELSGRNKRENRIYSVLFMDVDRFKSINDLHGHHMGDLVLKTVGNAATSLAREDDLVGRMGGDEFAILLSGADSAEAARVARRILEKVLASCRETSGVSLSVTASIGFAQFDPLNPALASELLEAADKALLAAKRQGGNLALCANTSG